MFVILVGIQLKEIFWEDGITDFLNCWNLNLDLIDEKSASVDALFSVLIKPGSASLQNFKQVLIQFVRTHLAHAAQAEVHGRHLNDDGEVPAGTDGDDDLRDLDAQEGDMVVFYAQAVNI